MISVPSSDQNASASSADKTALDEAFKVLSYAWNVLKSYAGDQAAATDDEPASPSVDSPVQAQDDEQVRPDHNPDRFLGLLRRLLWEVIDGIEPG